MIIQVTGHIIKVIYLLMMEINIMIVLIHYLMTELIGYLEQMRQLQSVSMLGLMILVIQKTGDRRVLLYMC